jgi:hypothetical protein
MDRQRGEREQAADQARRNESPVARRGKRIVPRRGMHQRVDEGANLGKHASLQTRPDTTDALPLSADRVRGRLSER